MIVIVIMIKSLNCYFQAVFKLSFLNPKPKSLLWPITTDLDNPINSLKGNIRAKCRSTCASKSQKMVLVFNTSDNLVEIAGQDLLASHRVCSKAELKQSQITLTDQLKTVLTTINKVYK